MDLGNFHQGQHKHFFQSTNQDSIDVAMEKLASQSHEDNSQIISLFKMIKDADSNSFVPKTLFVHPAQVDHSKVLDSHLFRRYLDFTKSLSDRKCQAECSMFLYPLFVHTYLDLLRRLQTEDAIALLRDFKHLFMKNENYSHIMQQLVQIKQYKDVVQSQNISCLVSNKYALKITEETYSELENFFTKDINLPFLQFIQFKVYLEIINCRDADDGIKEEPDEAHNGVHEQIDESFLYKESYMSTTEYKTFLDAKRKLDNLPPNPPSLLCWGINNLEQVSCAEINEKASLMLTGTLTGHINMSNLVLPILTDTREFPTNTVPLADPSYQPKPFRKLERSKYQNMAVYGNKGAVYDVAFVPDSKYFLSVSSDHYMRAYSIDTYNCAMKYSGHDMNIWSVECSSKGLALTASQDTTARIWSLELLHPIRIFVGHRQDVTCAKFHPNCVYVATGSYDKAVRLWNITDGASVRFFADHDSPVLSVAFSPCGKFLASGGMDGEVVINDLSNCKAISKFNLKHEPVTSLNWSTTGETLAAGSLTGIVTLQAWPSKSKIGLLDGTDIATYENVFQRILNIQYKKEPASQPICLGVPKDNVQETFLIKEESAPQG